MFPIDTEESAGRCGASLPRWNDLYHLPEHELGRIDIAQVHLACAEGLPGAQGLDVGHCRRTLDVWAARVRTYTESVGRQYVRDPASFDHSPGRFKMLAMVTVLQRDLGVRYRPELIEASDEAFFSDAEHLFLHGIVAGKGGSCPSLPLVYVAVGRRLGYPLKLVTASRHLFARWEEPGGERFNIECTTKGFVSHPDDYYRTWPHPLNAEQVEHYGVLRPLTPRQELADFLCLRGHCLSYSQRFRDAATAFAHAHELSSPKYIPGKCLVQAMNRWDRQVGARLMAGFPPMRIYFPPRHFPSLPKELEQELIHLTVKENLLNNPQLEREFWGPLRRDGRLPADRPLAHIEVRYPISRNQPVDIKLSKTLPGSFCQETAHRC